MCGTMIRSAYRKGFEEGRRVASLQNSKAITFPSFMNVDTTIMEIERAFAEIERREENEDLRHR